MNGAGLLLSNLVVSYETTRITGMDLYSTAASFNLPHCMIQSPVYVRELSSVVRHFCQASESTLQQQQNTLLQSLVVGVRK